MKPSLRQDREHINCPKSSLLLGAIPAPLSTHYPSVHCLLPREIRIHFLELYIKGIPQCVCVWLASFISHKHLKFSCVVGSSSVGFHSFTFIWCVVQACAYICFCHRRPLLEVGSPSYRVGPGDQSALVANVSLHQTTLEAQRMCDACMYVDTDKS